MTTGSVAQQRIRRGTSDVSTVVAGESEAGIWDAFVDTCPDAAAYHSWGWRGIFERAFGHTCVYLIARSGNSVCGVLPLVQINSLLFGRTLTSLPFVNYGGVLAGEEPVAEHVAARRPLKRPGRGAASMWSCGMSRAVFHRSRAASTRSPCSFAWPASTVSSLDRKVSNQIRKAEKSGLPSSAATSSCSMSSTRSLRGTCAIWARPCTAASCSARFSARFLNVPACTS